jgi:glycerol kinase
MIDSAEEIETCIKSVPDNGGVYCPALTGSWRTTLGSICQRCNRRITRGTTNAHIARATLEGIAYQVYDLVKAMEADFGKKGTELRVDGGAVNNLMMQFQSDLFDLK